MRNALIIFGFAVLLVGVAKEANAQSDVFGAGADSCGSWTVARQNNEVSAGFYEAWVQGYISGTEATLSAWRKKSVAINTDANGIFGWLDNYCQQKPTTNLAAASTAFVVSNIVISAQD